MISLKTMREMRPKPSAAETMQGTEWGGRLCPPRLGAQRRPPPHERFEPKPFPFCPFERFLRR